MAQFVEDCQPEGVPLDGLDQYSGPEPFEAGVEGDVGFAVEDWYSVPPGRFLDRILLLRCALVNGCRGCLGLGLSSTLAACVADPRSSQRILHSLASLLRRRIFGIPRAMRTAMKPPLYLPGDA